VSTAIRLVSLLNSGIDTVGFFPVRHLANDYAAGQLKDESQLLLSGVSNH
jgi:hypothetical protein